MSGINWDRDAARVRAVSTFLVLFCFERCFQRKKAGQPDFQTKLKQNYRRCHQRKETKGSNVCFLK